MSGWDNLALHGLLVSMHNPSAPPPPPLLTCVSDLSDCWDTKSTHVRTVRTGRFVWLEVTGSAGGLMAITLHPVKKQRGECRFFFLPFSQSGRSGVAWYHLHSRWTVPLQLKLSVNTLINTPTGLSEPSYKEPKPATHCLASVTFWNLSTSFHHPLTLVFHIPTTWPPCGQCH